MASAVLFRGFHGSVTDIIDVIMGFLVICSGVVLLQLAKSSKDVPDTKVLSGELDQIRTVAEVEEPEYEPRADTIRGGAGIVRAMSQVRHRREADEAKRIHEERMEAIGEDEVVQWDGLRRRKTVSTNSQGGSVRRAKSLHPPLGMSHFPDSDEDVSEPDSEVHPGFFGRIGRSFRSSKKKSNRGHSPVPMDSVSADKVDEEPEHVYGLPESLRKDEGGNYDDTAYRSPGPSGGPHIQWAGQGRDRGDSQGSSLAPPVPPHSSSSNKRQFSFQGVFSRHRPSTSGGADDDRPISRGALSFVSRGSHREYPTGASGTTEEERLGLVHGDSHKNLPKFDENDEDRRSSDEWQVTSGSAGSSPEQLGASGDLGHRRSRDPYADDDDDELYDEPLRSPAMRDDDNDGRGGSSHSGKGGRAFV